MHLVAKFTLWLLVDRVGERRGHSAAATREAAQIEEPGQ